LQVKVITEIRKNDKGERIKVERTVKVRCASLRVLAVLRGPRLLEPVSKLRLGARVSQGLR
jgi:hypothetical protein